MIIDYLKMKYYSADLLISHIKYLENIVLYLNILCAYIYNLIVKNYQIFSLNEKCTLLFYEVVT